MTDKSRIKSAVNGLCDAMTSDQCWALWGALVQVRPAVEALPVTPFVSDDDQPSHQNRISRPELIELIDTITDQIYEYGA